MPITITAQNRARLSRMVAATSFPTLSDTDLDDALTLFAISNPNTDDAPTGEWQYFDWNGAAAECWGWKEGKASDSVNMNADGRQASLSDIAEHCQKKKEEYIARRATGSIRVGVV
jgi:hypothetical protein